ncbi:hypothetical protein [Methylophilus sp. Leaf408]|uniref:hypothetical protein n=1 Tax=Methylophilus sp. Leaf408 TaxID=2876561 RepID=UPI001E5718AA|nr:hypothetical protein [Methylophilus sp. Leaf408]
MDYIEFRRHLGKAGMTIERFSSLVGVRANSVSNYSKKKHVPTQYAIIAILMGDSVDRGVDVNTLLSRFGIKPQSTAMKNITNIDHFRTQHSLGEI